MPGRACRRWLRGAIPAYCRALRSEAPLRCLKTRFTRASRTIPRLIIAYSKMNILCNQCISWHTSTMRSTEAEYSALQHAELSRIKLQGRGGWAPSGCVVRKGSQTKTGGIIMTHETVSVSVQPVMRSRREFLKLSGMAALSVGGMMFLAGCGPAPPGQRRRCRWRCFCVRHPARRWQDLARRHGGRLCSVQLAGL